MFLRNQPMNSNCAKNLIVFLVLMGLGGCVSPAAVEKSQVPAHPGQQLLAAGVRNFMVGDYSTAMQFFRKALIVGRGVDDIKGMALAEINMAETALGMGDIPQAREHLLEVQRMVEHDDLQGVSPRLEIISASISIREGRADEAIAELAPYLSDTNGAHDDYGCSEEIRLAALSSRAELAVVAADRQQARYWIKRYRQALDGMKSDEKRYQARLLRFEACLAHWDKNRRERDLILRRALEIYRADTARPGISALLVEWGRYLMDDADRVGARDRFDRAFFVRVEMRDRYGCQQILAMLEALDIGAGDEQRLVETRHWRQVVNNESPAKWDRLLGSRNPAR